MSNLPFFSSLWIQYAWRVGIGKGQDEKSFHQRKSMYSRKTLSRQETGSGTDLMEIFLQFLK